jgi:lipoprotein NlpD
MKSLLLPVLLALLVAGCANHPPAPVVERGTAFAKSPTADSRAGFHVVKKGDTLYSIALDNGQSYRDVAAWNYIDNPNMIRVGQSLRVAPPGQQAEDVSGGVIKPIKTTDVEEIRPIGASAPAAMSTQPPVLASSALKQEPKAGKQPYSEEAWARAQREAAAPPVVVAAAATAKPTEPVPASADKPVAAVAAASDETSDWVWPTAGKVGTPFAEGSSKGIDIPAKSGQPVLAASGGTVTLVSNAVRGYGNLVVIKHSQTLLSVYAHNSKVLVEEKQTVTKGQKIAEVGATDTDSPKLHFEIRRMGKPVDPLKFLPPH